MTFRITKTSNHLHTDQPKPCKNAKKIVEMDSLWRYEIIRWEWEVEINTLEELLDLQKEVGEELIISDEYIEIYDAYRE